MELGRDRYRLLFQLKGRIFCLAVWPSWSKTRMALYEVTGSNLSKTVFLVIKVKQLVFSEICFHCLGCSLEVNIVTSCLRALSHLPPIICPQEPATFFNCDQQPKNTELRGCVTLTPFINFLTMTF